MFSAFKCITLIKKSFKLTILYIYTNKLILEKHNKHTFYFVESIFLLNADCYLFPKYVEKSFMMFNHSLKSSNLLHFIWDPKILKFVV